MQVLIVCVCMFVRKGFSSRHVLHWRLCTALSTSLRKAASCSCDGASSVPSSPVVASPTSFVRVYMLFATSSFSFFARISRVDYACIPQPSCKIPLQESLIPEEVSRRGSFFWTFVSVGKSFQGGGSAARSKDDTDDETKGEQRRRRNTTDHRHKSAKSLGSSAKHWLGEAVKVSEHPFG